MSVETVNKPSTTMSDKIVDTIGDIVVASLEATAKISLGQGLLRIADRFLWVVEKSAQWSLPVHEVNAEENGKAFGKIELVRPLPWIFFLPSLVMLRACRLGINVGAVILGYPKLQATGMVKFIQKGRRRLRTIKSNGLKNMRYRKGSRSKEDELTEAKKSLIKSMLSTLSAMSCLENSRRTPSPPPTKLYVQRSSEPDTTPTPEEKSTTESNHSPQVDAKRKYSEVAEHDTSSEILSEEEETTEAKLERFGAVVDSESDDQNYDPVEELKLMMESESGEEEDDDDDDDDDDDYMISETEVDDLRVDNTSSNPIIVEPIIRNDVILEETEPEQELLSRIERQVETAAKLVAAMDRISTPLNTQKITEEKEIIDPLNLPEKIENHKPPQNEQLTPNIILETNGENIANFFSPINSPDSIISNFKSPSVIEEDHLRTHNIVASTSIDSVLNKEDQLLLQSTNKTSPKTIKETYTSETFIQDNIDVGVEQIEKSTAISHGILPDGQSKATITNGTTSNDENRSNSTTGISNRNGKHIELSQRKEKK